jgi:hypothetical protein
VGTDQLISVLVMQSLVMQSYLRVYINCEVQLKLVIHLNIYVGARVVCCAMDLKNLERNERGPFKK